MSWSAYLTDDRGHEEGSWNYTHNASVMIYAVLRDAGYELTASTRPCSRRNPDTGEWQSYPHGHGSISWWDELDGMDGPAGAAFLDLIVRRLVTDPVRFRAMNPENGWGDYDGLVKVLTTMRDAVPEWPCRWKATG